MLYLLLASCIWAFSFGLIGNVLADVPPAIVAAVRLTLALVAMLPFLRRHSAPDTIRLAAIGAVQFGLMYLCYNASFTCLRSHEVALLTALTPVYVTLLHDARQRRLAGRALLAALTAVAGAWVVLGRGALLPGSVRGFALVQASNVCFALGQVAYRDWSLRRVPLPTDPPRRVADVRTDAHAMGWLYLGGMLATLPWAWHDWVVSPIAISARQWLVILYLGIVASGLGFFLWNAGARRTPPGLLAVFNNLKIPLAAGFSLLVFGERGDPVRLSIGLVLLLAAVWLCQSHPSADKSPR